MKNVILVNNLVTINLFQQICKGKCSPCYMEKAVVIPLFKKMRNNVESIIEYSIDFNVR